MFAPAAPPSRSIELSATSLVHHTDPLSAQSYVQSRPAHAGPARRPLADAVPFVLSQREVAGGLARDNPAIRPAAPREGAPDTAGDRALAREARELLRAMLAGHGDQGMRAASVSEPEEDFAEVTVNIHALGENERPISNGEDARDVRAAVAEGGRVGLDDFLAPADVALRQNVFNLANVFDPKSLNDVELFGLSEEDESDGEEEPRRSAASLELGALADQDGEEEDVDEELDRLLGARYEPWKPPVARGKARKGGRKPVEDNPWAAEDKLDVTEFAQLVPDMAIEYPFNLDVFQRRAVFRLERDENVFVAAHTSAGKTVVAEYAIALAMQRKTKVVYTSPIKTLSNQKFRDFTERFGDVGIITGDISINPEAGCLVMTTEILRSMLYKGADLVRDLSHVIFDECHWLNDPERGVVWEEAIILLPPEVNIVMLSATVPNAMEFAKWVGRTKQKPIYVIHTRKRPVPLSHQLFVKGEVYPLFDSSEGRFLDANYRRGANHHKEKTKNANIRFGGGRYHAWMQIIKYLQKRDLDPAIFFCFSKRKCDEAAEQLHTQDLTAGATDKNQIHLFYQSAIARLSPTDRNVPQIARHREMLKRGVGVHHAGVLPIIKEITEVLFQQGLIRVLFATETFAMGVNMPARTVVFTAIHKYDNQGHRLLEPGEYIQMAGRAGRRGLDDVGTVLLFPAAAEFPVESDVKAVLTGMPKPLRSQFRLTYNMILNLLRIDELRVEDVMARSFSEAPAGRTSGTVQKLLMKGNERLNQMQNMSVEMERYRSLFEVSSRIEILCERISATLRNNAKNSTKSGFGVGRVVMVRGRDQTLRVGVIIKAPFAGRAKGGLSLKRPTLGLKTAGRGSKKDGGKVEMKVMALCGGAAVRRDQCPFLQHSFEGSESKKNKGKQMNASGLLVEIEDMGYEGIVGVSTLQIEVDERGLVPIRGEPNAVALSSAAEGLRRIALDEENWGGLVQVDPVRDLGLQSLDIVEMWEERKHCVRVLNEMVMELLKGGGMLEMEKELRLLSQESSLQQKLELLKLATSDDSLQLMPDYRQRMSVLNKLGYIDGTSVRLKGRAACEVNTCDSLILTELVFEKVIQDLEAADLCALLCSLIFQEKVSGDETSYSQIEVMREQSEGLYQACQSTLAVLSSLGRAQAEAGLAVSAAEFARGGANFGFTVGVRAWACGQTFAEICASVGGEVAEGTIVRTIVRLCELLRETRNVGRVIGDPELQSCAEEAMRLVRRDVIFAASLYVQ